MGKLRVRFSGPWLKRIPTENERLWNIPIGIRITQYCPIKSRDTICSWLFPINNSKVTSISFHRSASKRLVHVSSIPQMFFVKAELEDLRIFCFVQHHLTSRVLATLSRYRADYAISDGSTQSKWIMVDFPVVIVACVTRLGR